MIAKKLLNKAGILGLAAGLMASPLAFADMHDAPSADPAPATTAEDSLDGNQQANSPAQPSAADEDVFTDPETRAEPGTPAEDSGFAGGMDPMPNGEQPEARSDSQGDAAMPDAQDSDQQ
ncbi:MAG: hypothetical protein ACQEXC_12020 [Pseudomonadota bacterium]